MGDGGYNDQNYRAELVYKVGRKGHKGRFTRSELESQCWSQRIGGGRGPMLKVHSQVAFSSHPQGETCSFVLQEVVMLCWPHVDKVYSQLTVPHIPKRKLMLLSYRRFVMQCWQPDQQPT